MKEQADKVTISVYRNHDNGSWSAKKWRNRDEVLCDIDERDKALAIEICRTFAIHEGGLFHGPKYLFLPSGIYCNNGGGFSFITNTRDVGFTKITMRESELLLAYDCKTVWERILYWVKCKWQRLKFKMWYRTKGRKLEGVEVSDEPVAKAKEESNATT